MPVANITDFHNEPIEADPSLAAMVNLAFRSAIKVPCNLHGNPIPPKNGDWYDLAVSETVTLKAGTITIIPLGISIQLPEGYTAYILPRSSTPIKHGIILANSMGVIDHDYCGDDDILGFIAYALRDTTIDKGTRIAQMTVAPTSRVLFLPQESLGNENRGGFGSTGL